MDWALGGGIVCAGAATLYRVFALQAALGAAQAARRASEAAAEAAAHRCEQELAALRREHDALMERCGAGVMVLNANGVIDRANLTARQRLSVPTKTLVGKTLLQATLSEDLDSLFRSARESWSPQQREVRVPESGGNTLIVSIAPLPCKMGTPDCFLLVAHDVTELRRLETIRRDFVANVSHELRTPLASIRAMAETLQDGALDDPSVSSRFLGTIVTETHRLTRIAEDLLILSDAESHLPEKVLVRLSDMVSDILKRLNAQAEKAGITVTADLPPALDVLANPDQMEQVIVNLVDNAIKYTASGGKVHVTGERQAHGIAVHVADTGIGIMSQDLPRIFERFYRVDKARSRQSGGTGLGLSIVKHIVEAHGGLITVASEYNRGSTFTFILPTQEKAAPTPAVAAAKE